MKVINSSICENEENLEFIEIENAQVPKVKKGTALIEVKACGISAISSQVLYELFKKRPQLHYPAGCEISGVVIEIGEEVSTLSPGDKVAGLIPLDSKSSGFAQFCLCSEFDIVKLRDDINFDEAAGVIGDGMKAYTALHYLGHLLPNETILITDPLSSWGILMIQLAKAWGAKVLCVMFDGPSERTSLEELNIESIIDGSSKSFVSSLMEETGGLGVDVIVDNGVRQFTSEEDCKQISGERDAMLPHKHDLLSCLAVSGRWVTSQHNLQLDPPDSEQLYFRCASIGFLFEQVWTLAETRVGRFQHILKQVIENLASEVLKPNIVQTLSMSNVIDFLQEITPRMKGKTILKL